jgi:hypothetical protein
MQKQFLLITEVAVILAKLMVAQLNKTFPALYLQKLIMVFTRPATGRYPKPDKSNPHFLTIVLLVI